MTSSSLYISFSWLKHQLSTFELGIRKTKRSTQEIFRKVHLGIVPEWSFHQPPISKKSLPSIIVKLNWPPVLLSALRSIVAVLFRFEIFMHRKVAQNIRSQSMDRKKKENSALGLLIAESWLRTRRVIIFMCTVISLLYSNGVRSMF